MVVGIKPEKIEEYERLHADSNPGVRDLLTKYHMHNFSIFLQQIEGKWYEFGYYEYTGDDFDADMAALAKEPRNIEWLKVCDPMQFRCRARRVGPKWNGYTTTRDLKFSKSETDLKTRETETQSVGTLAGGRFRKPVPPNGAWTSLSHLPHPTLKKGRHREFQNLVVHLLLAFAASMARAEEMTAERHKAELDKLLATNGQDHRRWALQADGGIV